MDWPAHVGPRLPARFRPGRPAVAAGTATTGPRRLTARPARGGCIWILGTPISSVGPSISSVTFDIEDFDIECSFNIDVFYTRYRISISKVFDIEGHTTRYRRRHTIDIKGYEKDCRCRSFVSTISNINHSISYLDIVSISKAFLTFDIDCYVVRYRTLEYLVRYRIQCSIDPMAFTAERKLPLPRRHHAAADESQRHEPWIPATSFCGSPQLDPQRFDEERSFHSAASTC
jgi:hypothetical protein